MAVSPVNIARVTFRSSLNVDSLRANQRDVFQSQVRISTGRSFVTPSEDPTAASQAFGLNNLMARHVQFSKNIQTGSAILREADNAINEVNTLLIEAQTIATQNLSNLVSADERVAEAELVAAIRQQLVNVGNRTFNGRYIFAGRLTKSAPFVDAFGGIAYLGDIGDLNVRIAEGTVEAINIPGNQLFGALSGSVSGQTDLSPALTADTRLEDLRGAAGRGVRIGELVFTAQGGAGSFTVDLTPADTIGDVTELINRAAQDAGFGVTASLGDGGLVITPGSDPLTISDVGGTGVTAADLGIKTSEPATAAITGADLSPKVARLTPVEALGAGDGGIDLAGGLLITNGDRQVVVDLSNAQTVQDIINAVNNAGVYVLARINDAGTAIDMFNQVSGMRLTIGESEGTTAGDLGLRTLDSDTALSQLNLGRGVSVVEGQDDMRITGKDGAAVVDVSLDGTRTVGDVIERINEAATQAGASIKASLAPAAGILIADTSGGDGVVTVSRLNLSTAADDLGLMKAADPETGDLIGDDVNAARADGILDALIELENALRGDDDHGISNAGERLERIVEDVIRVHGVVGARSQGMEAKLDQMQDAVAATQTLLSQVEDLDFTEAITELQAAQTVLRANLLTTAQLQNLSLLDYIR